MLATATLESRHNERVPSNFFKLFPIYNSTFSVSEFHTWKENYLEDFS